MDKFLWMNKLLIWLKKKQKIWIDLYNIELKTKNFPKSKPNCRLLVNSTKCLKENIALILYKLPKTEEEKQNKTKLPNTFYEPRITMVQKSDNYNLRRLQNIIPMNIGTKILILEHRMKQNIKRIEHHNDVHLSCKAGSTFFLKIYFTISME